MVRAEFGGRVSHTLPQERSLATAFDAVTEMSRASFQADVRVKMVHMMRAIIENLVAELTAGHFLAIVEQAVLRELCSMVHPSVVGYVPKRGKFNDIMPEGFQKTATFTKTADNSAKNGGGAASVLADTPKTFGMDQFKQPAAAVKRSCINFPETGPVNFAQEDVDSFKKENYDQDIVDCDEWKTSLVEEIPQPAKVIVNEALKQVTVCNEPTSNDPVPEKGPAQDTNGTADWVVTAAKGKEQDDDDEDDDDDDDDDDYEEEEEEENDNKIEPGDDEEDVEGEDEEGEEEAGDEDGDDDGEADDNGEGQDDDGEEEGEEEDDVEGEEDGDEDGDEEPEEDEEDGEEDPEDEDEDEVEGESEEDIEDLEPPKKKRK